MIQEQEFINIYALYFLNGISSGKGCGVGGSGSCD